jgi:hypothetical protein
MVHNSWTYGGLGGYAGNTGTAVASVRSEAIITGYYRRLNTNPITLAMLSNHGTNNFANLDRTIDEDLTTFSQANITGFANPETGILRITYPFQEGDVFYYKRSLNINNGSANARNSTYAIRDADGNNLIIQTKNTPATSVHNVEDEYTSVIIPRNMNFVDIHVVRLGGSGVSILTNIYQLGVIPKEEQTRIYERRI